MGLPEPYYERDGISIFLGDCRDILPHLPPVDLVLTDPPYGISYQSHHNSGRQNSGEWLAWTRRENFAPICGDEEPFDPAPVLSLGVRTILWGANHYASRLPDSSAWIWWDKLGDMGPCDQADGELAWTNLRGPVRRFVHEWRGLIRRGEENVVSAYKLHPNQKPVRLMRWCIEKAGDGVSTILDPFMGSGTTLVAARDLGRKAIGIEIEERYCEIAVRRLSQQLLPFEAAAHG